MKATIGLETHVQLNSASKLFCGCKNPVTIDEEAAPNTYTCPTCLGLPGSKPRINERVIEEAIAIALSLGCEVAKEMFFSRKTYFYPDMSKNFQITQYEVPLGQGGHVLVEGKRIRIRRIHIEEDPSKLVHTEHGILADYNRAGTPLVEIVTEPDFDSPKQARAYLQKLVLILEYLGVYHSASQAIVKSDANVSIAETGLGTRVEVKNITGTKEIERALQYEIMRQTALLKRGGAVQRETRMWNPDVGVTQEMRSKEGEEEYGYIFEPDLTRIENRSEVIKTISSRLPELPDQKYERFVKEYGLAGKIAEAIITDLDLTVLFERLAARLDPKLAGSWIAGYLMKTLNYNECSFMDSGVTEDDLFYLLDLYRKGEITDRNAEQVIRKIVDEKARAPHIVRKYDLLVKRFDVDVVLRQLIDKNAAAVEDFKKGNEKSLHFLVGLAMRDTKGSVDANEIRKRLHAILQGV